jgi:hypothetical protein
MRIGSARTGRMQFLVQRRGDPAHIYINQPYIDRTPALGNIGSHKNLFSWNQNWLSGSAHTNRHLEISQVPRLAAKDERC